MSTLSLSNLAPALKPREIFLMDRATEEAHG